MYFLFLERYEEYPDDVPDYFRVVDLRNGKQVDKKKGHDKICKGTVLYAKEADPMDNFGGSKHAE